MGCFICDLSVCGSQLSRFLLTCALLIQTSALALWRRHLGNCTASDMNADGMISKAVQFATEVNASSNKNARLSLGVETSCFQKGDASDRKYQYKLSFCKWHVAALSPFLTLLHATVYAVPVQDKPQSWKLTRVHVRWYELVTGLFFLSFTSFCAFYISGPFSFSATVRANYIASLVLAGHNEGGTSIAYMNDQMRLTAAALDALGLYEGVFDMSMPWAIEVRKKKTARFHRFHFPCFGGVKCRNLNNAWFLIHYCYSDTS